MSRHPQLSSYDPAKEDILMPEGAPIGLTPLLNADRVLIRQELEPIEGLHQYEKNKRFTLMNGLGEVIFYGVIDSDCCTGAFCGNRRCFDLNIFAANSSKSNAFQPVMHITRGLRWDCCIFPCCQQRIDVQAPPGELVGFVQQCISPCRPKFEVRNSDDKAMLDVTASVCGTYNICGNVEFNVFGAGTDEKVGRISQLWSGVSRQMFSETDIFGVSFPKDMDILCKATTLGALFLIDMLYFQDKTYKPRRHLEDAPPPEAPIEEQPAVEPPPAKPKKQKKGQESK